MARGKWSQPGVPHKGWVLLDFEDLGGVYETCQMCETMSIRYVHHMEHPSYPEVLGVGQVCASKMEEDYRAAAARERTAKNVAKRRSNWMSTEWRESEKGNHYINRQDFNIVLFRRSGSWAYRIARRNTGKEESSGSGLATEQEAKLEAFEQFIALLGQ